MQELIFMVIALLTGVVAAALIYRKTGGDCIP